MTTVVISNELMEALENRLKAQAETIARLEAELAQCKHALDDEGEICKCGHSMSEHGERGCYICNCYEAAK